MAYEELLAEVLSHGLPKGDRTGTGTRSLFARRLRYDLRAGFPRITTPTDNVLNLFSTGPPPEFR